MGIDFDNYWMRLQGFNRDTNGQYKYILWRSSDKKGKYIYQVTNGEMPPKNDAGYYDKTALLKLKGLINAR